MKFRKTNRYEFSAGFNAPVPSFGSIASQVLIVGLAPGLKGANITGRPFTGDFAGDLLYPSLLKFGFAQGTYARHAHDGLKLLNVRISNAVRCVPPQNKPVGIEVKTCQKFLISEIKAMENLKIILALGVLAHHSILSALNIKKCDHKFVHGAQYLLPHKLILTDSYHCSRYNTNTGKLTEAMFHSVFEGITSIITR